MKDPQINAQAIRVVLYIVVSGKIAKFILLIESRVLNLQPERRWIAVNFSTSKVMYTSGIVEYIRCVGI